MDYFENDPVQPVVKQRVGSVVKRVVAVVGVVAVVSVVVMLVVVV